MRSLVEKSSYAILAMLVLEEKKSSVKLLQIIPPHSSTDPVHKSSFLTRVFHHWSRVPPHSWWSLCNSTFSFPETAWAAEGCAGEPRTQHEADDNVAWLSAADGVQEAVLPESTEPGVHRAGHSGGRGGQAGPVNQQWTEQALAFN